MLLARGNLVGGGVTSAKGFTLMAAEAQGIAPPEASPARISLMMRRVAVITPFTLPTIPGGASSSGAGATSVKACTSSVMAPSVHVQLMEEVTVSSTVVIMPCPSVDN
jgi:hypothetical protein